MIPLEYMSFDPLIAQLKSEESIDREKYDKIDPENIHEMPVGGNDK